ncbi:MAG: SDR family oxidoreductase [Bacteroidales bacterium]|jgi:NAD(P)-dependent dehydrogenase (short-subunit alcohol dehydrogenase family)
MKGKIVLITGATSGIGEATAMALAKMQATLVLVARDKNKAIETVEEIKSESKNPNVEYLLCDLSSLSSVRQLAAEFKNKYNRLDVLINNAGLILSKRETTIDGFEKTLAVCHLAHFLLTNLLLDTIKSSKPSRIINVSSVAHLMGHIDFDDLMFEKKYSSAKSYGQAKLANVLFTKKLAEKLEGTEVTVNSVHPGGVNTKFDRDLKGFYKFAWSSFKPFLLTPEKGAETSIYLASSPEVDGVSGEYFAKKKIKRTSKESYDSEIADKLWKVSEKFAGLVA